MSSGNAGGTGGGRLAAASAAAAAADVFCFGNQLAQSIDSVGQRTGLELDQAAAAGRLGRIIAEEKCGEILAVGAGFAGERCHGEIRKIVAQCIDLQPDLCGPRLGRGHLRLCARNRLFGGAEAGFLQIDEAVDGLERVGHVVEVCGGGVDLCGLGRQFLLDDLSLVFEVLEGVHVILRPRRRQSAQEGEQQHQRRCGTRTRDEELHSGHPGQPSRNRSTIRRAARVSSFGGCRAQLPFVLQCQDSLGRFRKP